jgi:hypothetical protein
MRILGTLVLMTRAVKVKLSLFFTLVSFGALVLLTGLTSPVSNIEFALVFFGLLFVFLISFGHLWVFLRKGQLGPKSRGRIVIISVFVVLALMFSSSQSLNWVDGLILLLVLGGLLFYSSRRAA